MTVGLEIPYRINVKCFVLAEVTAAQKILRSYNFSTNQKCHTIKGTHLARAAGMNGIKKFASIIVSLKSKSQNMKCDKK